MKYNLNFNNIRIDIDVEKDEIEIKDDAYMYIYLDFHLLMKIVEYAKECYRKEMYVVE